MTETPLAATESSRARAHTAVATAPLADPTSLLRPLLIVALAALLAYAISPAVRPWFLSRQRERWWPLPAH
jgi:hypothetical protein